MSTLSTEFASIGQSGFGKSNIVTRLVESIKTSMDATRTYNELNGLTDEQLRDIGVYRNDIPNIAFGNK